ncbi:hypothetical protein KP509_06G076300 [Ceratopteris richardii]|uniref:Methyltransferase type 11 domain-containing protein n=1 Tax=Ceratopteris richardii TaxID=49495 RepID=A0A8T2UHX3_CERRI|nr:hypothetical protein KP509_06G076300 [Ceratopteris richardii]
MAGLFDEQASLYAAARPDHPSSLFSYLASLSPYHGRAWDVGTGSGQAAVPLQHACRRDNIKFICTRPSLSSEDLENIVGGEGSIDLITVAQAPHWFHLDSFYVNVKKVLKKKHGVFAAWCYTQPSVCTEIDALLKDFYRESDPYWDPARKIVDDGYTSLPFPFEPVQGHDGTGAPFHFEAKKAMTVDTFLTYLESMSVLHCARSQGIELLHEKRKNAFRMAWDDAIRTATYPIHLRVGWKKQEQIRFHKYSKVTSLHL